MIIWGWGHRKTDTYGEATEVIVCARCNNEVRRVVLKDTTYFTLFFIPLIPYKSEHFVVCPVCGDAYALTKEAFNTITAGNRA